MKNLGSFLRKSCDIFRNRYLSLLFRLALGVTFVVSGAGKLPEGGSFVAKVEEFDLLPVVLARFYGATLPWLEVIIGALLILGLFSRFASAIGSLVAFSFIVANSVVLYRGLNLECGCFGDLAVLRSRDALIIDIVVLIMALQILLRKGEFLSLDSKIFRRKTSD